MDNSFLIFVTIKVIIYIKQIIAESVSVSEEYSNIDVLTLIPVQIRGTVKNVSPVPGCSG
jgi:hypothetical protein